MMDIKERIIRVISAAIRAELVEGRLSRDLYADQILNLPIERECPECKGTGTHIKRSPSDFGAVICFTCYGTGKLSKTLKEIIDDRGN